MLKKYFVVFTALLFILNFVGIAKAAGPEEEFGWDYTDGWFDKNPGKFTAPIEIYDNDLSTYKYSGVNGSFEVKFHEPITTGVLGFYIKSGGTYASYAIYNGNKLLYSNDATTSYIAVKIFDPIDKIVFRSGNYGSISVYEFDLFDSANYPTPKNLKVTNKSFNEINVDWVNPSDVIGSRVYFDNVLVKTLGKDATSYKFDGLKASTKYAISVSSIYKDGESITNDISVTTNDVPALPGDFVKVGDISATTALFNLNIDKLPTLPKQVRIYKTSKDNDPITVPVITSSVVPKRIEGLKTETEYTYYVAVDYGNGNVTEKLPVTFKTLEPGREVTGLKATATSNDVSLSWQMPVYQSLSKARIYRQKQESGMFARMFMAASTYDPIFETNGTTFKDLTVNADTEYTYKVTTVDTNENETDGKTIKIRTQKMSVGGGGTATDGNGDFVITWTSPTSGQIKVMVGGVQYAIVPASDQKIVIPKNQMKFDLLGNPDVQLIPIDANGNPGIPTKPGAGGTGNGGGIGNIVGGGTAGQIINAGNVLQNGVELLTVVGMFILLGLSFRVVPKLVRMIRNSLTHKDTENDYGRRRVGE